MFRLDQCKKFVRDSYRGFRPLKLKKPAAVVFLYHTVESDEKGFRERSPWTSGHRYITSLSVFKKQISFITNHFYILPTSELIDRLNNGIQEKESIAAIHFDDEFKSYMVSLYQ